MIIMPSIPDPYTVLVAIADHIKTHPELADTVTSVSPGRAEFQIYPAVHDRTQPRQHLRVLAQWIGSAYDVAPAIVTAVPDNVERTHLAVYCQLHDGTAVTVIVVLKGDDHKVLTSSVLGVLRVGDAVPVAHLLALADGWTAGEEPVELPVDEPVVERVLDQVGDTFRAEEFVADTICPVGEVEDQVVDVVTEQTGGKVLAEESVTLHEPVAEVADVE